MEDRETMQAFVETIHEVIDEITDREIDALKLRASRAAEEIERHESNHFNSRNQSGQRNSHQISNRESQRFKDAFLPVPTIEHAEVQGKDSSDVMDDPIIGDSFDRIEFPDPVIGEDLDRSRKEDSYFDS